MNRDSFLTHCVIKVRPGDGPLFSWSEEQGVQAYLNGYAIVPLENYSEPLEKMGRFESAWKSFRSSPLYDIAAGAGIAYWIVAIVKAVS